MGFVLSACLAVVSLIAAAVPAITIPAGMGGGDGPLYPAPPGYQLPWAGGEIESVTQGEETALTHNGLSAYAIDFGLNYDTVVASRSGKVSMIYVGSNRSGCDPSLNIASNYVVIDHGDGTSALYLHLAYNSALVAAGDLVEQGQPIAISGDTGTTCSDGETDTAAPHLHFAVQQFEENHYMTQSVPIAFDDIPDNEGVAVEGREYVSGNYHGGRPQKSTLTPWRSQRVFSPKATPADPSLAEIPLAPETPAPIDQMAPTEAPAVETPSDGLPTLRPTDSDTATAEPVDTATPAPSATPASSDTPTASPIPSDTATAAASDTPSPAASDTPTSEPEPTP